MKKENDPITHKEEPSDTPPPPDIPGDTPIESCLQVNTITVTYKESETPKEEDPPPVPTATPNLEEFIPAPTYAEKEQEDTVVTPNITPDKMEWFHIPFLVNWTE